MRFSHTLPFLAALATARPTEESLDRRDDGPDAGSVQVTGISFAGTGCPSGSATSGPFLSGTSTLILPAFDLIAQTGKNVATADVRENCQFNAKFKYPAGWQFSISKAEYRGRASIPAGITGVSKSTYFFSGNQGQVCLSPFCKSEKKKKKEKRSDADDMHCRSP